MERGSIKITENDRLEFAVEVMFVNGEMWLTESEIAYAFSVMVPKIRSGLRTIFASRVLWEHEVSKSYKYERNGKEYHTILYNFETLVAISFHIGSRESQAFRRWIMNTVKAINSVDRENKQRYVVVCSIPFSTRKSDTLD